MPQHLVIFDCDGTLVDSEVIACRVFTKYWSTHGVHFTEDEFKEKFIGTGRNAQIVVETFSRMPAHADEEGDRLFDQALAQDLRAVSGMESLLDSLAGIELCAASNSSLKYVERALKSAGLDRFFSQKIFSAEQVRNPKPEPDVFLLAASRLGFQPNECIVIEDSVSGIRAAQAAQMKVVGFSGAAHFVPSLESRIKDAKPDWFCASTQALQDLLAEMGPSL